MRTFLVITLIAAASAAGWNTYQAPPTYKAPAKPTAPKVDFTTAEDVVETIFPADKNDSCPEGTAQYSKPTTVNGVTTTTIVCIPCAANGCMDCSGPTTEPSNYLVCNTCDAGFGLYAIRIPLLPTLFLPPLCRRCSDASPNCKTCESPIVFPPGDDVDSLALFECTECNAGFFMGPDANSILSPSPSDQCIGCGDTENGGTYQCTACSPATEPVPDGTTATIVTCSACATGYLLQNNICNQCDGLNGYVDDQSLEVSAEHAHCVTCNSVFPTGHCKTCSSDRNGSIVTYACITCPDGSTPDATSHLCPAPKPTKPTKSTKPTYNSRNNNYRGW